MGTMVVARSSSSGFLAAMAQSRPRLAGLMGVVLMGIALAVGCLTLATPFVGLLVDRAPRVPLHVAVVLASAYALLAPGVFLVLGLSGLREAVSAMRRDAGLRAIDGAARGEPELVLVGPVRVGRVTVPRALVGAHGVTLMWPLADQAHVRHEGGRWLAQAARGTWVPIPDPIETAALDAAAIAEHVRRTVPEFPVPVAAVAVMGPSSPRSDACPTIDPDHVAAFVAGLARRHGLAPSQVRRVVDVLQHS